MTEFPLFPACTCEMHDTKIRVPEDALIDPFLYLPPPVTFTDEMAVLAHRYLGSDFNWSTYPVFQAAAFLKPDAPEQHEKRRVQYLELEASAESQGYCLPKSLTRLFMSDEYINRLHHNCVWWKLPEKIIPLPSNPELAVLLFLTEGQGCCFWHLLLAPDGSHTIVTSDDAFGCYREYPRTPNPEKFSVYQCMDNLDRLLYSYFVASAEHDIQYLRRIETYFSETSSSQQ